MLMSAMASTTRLSSKHATNAATTSDRINTYSCALRIRSRNTVSVRASYDVDVEPERRAAPDAGPGRWGAPPPPPPPPPAPQQTSRGLPSRREALFGLLGAGLGVGATTAYYRTQYDDSPEALAQALDELLEDPEFIDAVADQVMFEEFQQNMEDAGAELDSMRNELVTESADMKAAESRKK